MLRIGIAVNAVGFTAETHSRTVAALVFGVSPINVHQQLAHYPTLEYLGVAHSQKRLGPDAASARSEKLSSEQWRQLARD